MNYNEIVKKTIIDITIIWYVLKNYNLCFLSQYAFQNHFLYSAPISEWEIGKAIKNKLMYS